MIRVRPDGALAIIAHPLMEGFSVNYARRQQYRRLSRAASTGKASAGALMLALTAASTGAVSAAGVLLMIALAFGLFAIETKTRA